MNGKIKDEWMNPLQSTGLSEWLTRRSHLQAFQVFLQIKEFIL